MDVSYDSLRIRKDVFIILVNTKHKNIKKLALVSGAMLGAMVIGTQAANADTQIDSNHVRVEQGDTISEIAQEHNVSVDSLAQANHLSNPDIIFVGDNLVLAPNASNSETTTQNPSDGDSQHMYQPVHMIENNENTTNQSQTTVKQSAPVTTSTTTQSQTSSNGNSGATTQGSGSVHDQFIAAGGTEEMWNAIVMPESGGNPSATNGQYSGLGQTNQSWGTGSVAEQTQGMINYANSRYNSISNAIAFRASNGYW